MLGTTTNRLIIATIIRKKNNTIIPIDRVSAFLALYILTAVSTIAAAAAAMSENRDMYAAIFIVHLQSYKIPLPQCLGGRG
jgi:hypothetical protein